MRRPYGPRGIRRSHRRYAIEEAAAARGAGRHVLAADEVRRNQRERLQSPGHEPTQRDDYSSSAPLPDPRPGATSGVVEPLLDIRERLQIADLLRLGFSVRRIAAELGWHPSTIKRELDRHRSPRGRYLPRTADHDARQQRAAPRARKLTANITLRRLVQRKQNRCWSPDEVCGWLRKTYPDDPPARLAGSRQVVAGTVGVNPSTAVPRAR